MSFRLPKIIALMRAIYFFIDAMILRSFRSLAFVAFIHSFACNDVFEGNRPALLYANRKTIQKLDLETSKVSELVSGLRNTVAFNYHYEKKLLVFADNSDGKILSISFPENITTLLHYNNIRVVDGLAIDWIYDRIYWTDTTRNTIELSDLNGLNRKLLFDVNIDEPRAIVLNPLDGWMFWSDWGRLAKIEKAGMDGSHRTVVVDSNIRWPNGLAIDFATKTIFWADGSTEQISSVDYDGKNRRLLLSSHSSLKHPFSMDVFETWLYWTDWTTDKIHKVNKFTGNYVQDVVGVSNPMNVHVFHRSKQPTGINYCSYMYSNCSHLCLPAPIFTKAANYTCVCPDSMTLDSNGQTCIFQDYRKRLTTVTYAKETESEDLNTATFFTTVSLPVTIPVPIPTIRNARSTTSYPSTRNWSRARTAYSQYFRPTNSPRMDDGIESAVSSQVAESSTASQASFSAEINLPLSSLNENVVGRLEKAMENCGQRTAGIVIGVLICLTLAVCFVTFFVYKFYLKKNGVSMVFDNPIYCKNKEDKFSLEENHHCIDNTYSSGLEPLTTGTKEIA